MTYLTKLFTLTLIIATITLSHAHAFCGFFVNKAGADLFNKASKVVLTRSEGRSVITMANDFQGDINEFAIVTPVPEVLTEGQVNVAENALIDHIDAYTAPRLVEYFDSNPCENRLYQLKGMRSNAVAEMAVMSASPAQTPRSLGVTIEAEYSVGEYDIVILSAEQSDGLFTYLNQEGYKIPDGAQDILGSYIKQDMKFFLAKVNLDAQAKSGYSYLRPLQVAYESEKFMLPIRLGTLNAQGDQDLILFTLTQQGRVEPSNYRTVKIPSDMDIPVYVKDEFSDFYKAMFATAAQKERNKVAFLEYAWDMNWCDPCAADPLSVQELRSLGAWWIEAPEKARPIQPLRQGQRSFVAPPPQAANAFVTRLHMRYNADSFPEDIMLHETVDRSNFQGRYVLRHTFDGEMSCDAGKNYLQSLPARHEKEAKTLANLTGWDVNAIRTKMRERGHILNQGDLPAQKPWWQEMWSK